MKEQKSPFPWFVFGHPTLHLSSPFRSPFMMAFGGKSHQLQFWNIFSSFSSFKGLHSFISSCFTLYFILSMRAVRSYGVQTLPRSNLDGISFFLSFWFSNFKCLCLWYLHRCVYQKWRKPWKPAAARVTRRIVKSTTRKTTYLG